MAFAAKQAKLADGDWHVEYLDPKPDPFTAFVQGIVKPEEDARGPASLAAVVAARRNADIAGMGEDIEMLLTHPGLQARCFGCPASARLMRGDAEMPRWLVAARALLGG